MIYHSVAEIYATKKTSLEKIEELVRGLNSDQAAFRLTPDRWSIAEILEHLGLVEEGINRLVISLLTKTEDAAKTMAMKPTFPISVQDVFERSVDEKYTTRDNTVPRGRKTIPESLASLHDCQSQLQHLEPRLASVDLKFASFPHWIFGPLNLGQWLAFVSLHEERHLRQIESILRSPGFPKTS